MFELIPPDKFEYSFTFRIFISHEIFDRGHPRRDRRHRDIRLRIRNRDILQSDHHGVVVDRRGSLFLVRILRRDLAHQRFAHERRERRAESRAGVSEIGEVNMLVSLGILRGLAREDVRKYLRDRNVVAFHAVLLGAVDRFNRVPPREASAEPRREFLEPAIRNDLILVGDYHDRVHVGQLKEGLVLVLAKVELEFVVNSLHREGSRSDVEHSRQKRNETLDVILDEGVEAKVRHIQHQPDQTEGDPQSIGQRRGSVSRGEGLVGPRDKAVIGRRQRGFSWLPFGVSVGHEPLVRQKFVMEHQDRVASDRAAPEDEPIESEASQQFQNHEKQVGGFAVAERDQVPLGVPAASRIVDAQVRAVSLAMRKQVDSLVA